MKSKIPVVYIAGKFRAPHFWGTVQNIRAAEAVALEVWRAGAAALTPHTNTGNFEGALGDSKGNAAIWLDGAIELLRRCDAVVLVPNWVDSSGAKAEVAVAFDAGLPVFAVDGASADLRLAGRGPRVAQGWTDFLRWVKERRG